MLAAQENNPKKKTSNNSSVDPIPRNGIKKKSDKRHLGVGKSKDEVFKFINFYRGASPRRFVGSKEKESVRNSELKGRNPKRVPQPCLTSVGFGEASGAPKRTQKVGEKIQ